jgi:1-deoxy-D-xylulose 5-phosphate reductoisomerase
MGFEVAKKGGTAAAVFNAANEAAVEQFLAGKIKFGNIVELVRRCLDNCDRIFTAEHAETAEKKLKMNSALEKGYIKPDTTLEELLEADAWAKKEVMECLKNHQLR